MDKRKRDKKLYKALVEQHGCGPATATKIINKIKLSHNLTEREGGLLAAAKLHIRTYSLDPQEGDEASEHTPVLIGHEFGVEQLLIFGSYWGIAGLIAYAGFDYDWWKVSLGMAVVLFLSIFFFLFEETKWGFIRKYTVIELVEIIKIIIFGTAFFPLVWGVIYIGGIFIDIVISAFLGAGNCPGYILRGRCNPIYE